MGRLRFLVPLPERTFTGSPGGLFSEVTATDAAAVVVALITQRADLEAMLEFQSFNLLQSVRHMRCEGLREVGRHLEGAWQGGFFP
jgi:hypothetical protein